MLNKTRWALATLVVNLGLLGCSDDGGSDPVGGSGGSSPGGASSGGAAPTSGGSSSGGATSGGSSSGGATFGGSSNGGSSSGGATFGGSSNGGSSSGGKSSTSGGSSSGGKSASGGSSSGGKSTSGGSSSGGSGSGGKSTSGGSSSGGKTSGGATGTGGTPNTGAGPSVTCACLKSAGNFSGNNIKSTIVVDGGEVYDGKCMTYIADANSLGDGSQEEGQSPVFEINNGTIQNLILGSPAADGIHIEGGPANIKNVHWLDIGEDAMSVPSNVGGNPTINVDCGSSAQGEDKTFQNNSPATWNFKNFTARSAGKFMRQNGDDKTEKMTLNIDHCDIAGMKESIFRTESPNSMFNMTNTRYSGIPNIFIAPGNAKIANANVGDHAQVGNFTGNVAY